MWVAARKAATFFLFTTMTQRYTLLLLLLGIFCQTSHAQAPVIQAITPLSSTVEQYGKFEARLNLTAAFANPYDYDEIRVTATFTTPGGGEQTTVEGFYMEDFEIVTSTGALTTLPTKGFRIRFSPRKPGQWSYTVSCTNASGTGSFPAQTFNCTPAAAAKNKGFVQAGSGNFLKFETGGQYIPVGENIAWQQSNPYLDYKKWVGKLADNGGNFLRLWLCHWGLGMEWKNNSSGFSGLKKYKQSSAFYLDWLFDLCAERGVYVMFCLNHHGQVSSQVNPNWSDSPYNAVNGGPCQNTWDFFSNPQAKSLMKNRLRYTLARWGCQRSIMTWELFNEVNWTDNYEQHKPAVAAWHAEMSAFLKQRDFAARPVSTSCGSPESEDPAVWNNPDMDYSQRHYYFDSPNLEAILAAGTLENLDEYDKPALIGEFGLSAAGSSLSTLDPAGIHIHNSLWGPLFGGGLGTGMSWWWDSYIEPKNLYTHFAGVSAVAAQVPLDGSFFRPTTASVSGGAAGELKLNPSLGWAGLGDTLIQISGDGTVSPSNYKLGQFLYGSQWNTQYRRPPVFKVNMPQAGQFKVLTGSQLATSPNLTVWLDGAKVLSVAPTANQTYTVTVPAGQHTLKVDNLGTDWLSIAGYAITGIGSALDAYVLKSADNSRIAAWVLNSNYNHVFVKANGAPNAVSGGALTVSGMADGSYTAKWLDCQTGALLQAAPVTVSGGNLALTVPDLVWDIALVVDATSADDEAWPLRTLPVSVFPNPVSEGAANVSFFLENAENVEVELLNAGGAMVQQVFSGRLEAGEQRIEAVLPTGLSAGIYWLKLTGGKYRATKALGVVR